MGENRQDEQYFVRETIKDKPRAILRRKTVRSLAVSFACAVVFALVFCAVTLLVLPKLLALKGVDISLRDSATEETEEPEQDTESGETAVEAGTQSTESTVFQTAGTGGAASGGTAVTGETENLSVEDYQYIQSRLYSIGRTANRSIVIVTGVTNEKDWFDKSYEFTGQGSGVVIGETAGQYLILTERKLIEGAASLSVTFSDETTAGASIVGIDENTGLAVIAVEKQNVGTTTAMTIEIAQFGSSDTVIPGTVVIALGSPLGNAYSILTGTVTSNANEIPTVDHNYKIFTSDIVSNQTGSGVLINTAGEVVGVIMQSYGGAGNEDTIVAVPISQLRTIISILCEGKGIPYIGVYGSTVTDKISKNYGLPKGVYIMNLAGDSPAMIAGLQVGDVITAVGGVSIYNMAGYSSTILAHRPDEKIEVVVQRKGADGYAEIPYTIQLGVLYQNYKE